MLIVSHDTEMINGIFLFLFAALITSRTENVSFWQAIFISF